MLLVLLPDSLYNHVDPSPDAMLVANRPLSSEPCPQTKRSCLAQEVTHLHWVCDPLNYIATYDRLTGVQKFRPLR